MDHEIDGTRCAHEMMVGSRFGTIVSVSTYLRHAPRCAECHILVQIIDEFKPGWMAATRDAGGLVNLTRTAIYTVRLLLLSPPDQTNIESYYAADTKVVGQFQFFHRSKAEPFYETPLPWDEYEAGDKVRRARAQSLAVVHDSSSREAMDRAARWLAHCVENDEACNLADHDFVPRRLINVGPKDGSQDPVLYEPTGPTRYACLSYCWGADTVGVLTTTRANLQNHYGSIPTSNMPLGIQDAITVCRSLGIPNLWVDSLCIVQDDDAAWIEDASQMDHIYLNSYLTIAALEPASCKLPFLGKQKFGDPAWQRRFVPEYTPAAGDPPLETFIRGTVVERDGPEQKSSLDQRGWCLQEGLLPNRRLCFDGNEMTWECLCRKICECGHILWRPQSFRFGQLGALLKSPRLKAVPVFSEPRPAIPWDEAWHGVAWLRPNQGYKRWRELVTEFSGRCLSRPEDKLSAVFGLAKIVNEGLPGSDSLAGGNDWTDSEDESPPRSDGGVGAPPSLNQYVAGLWKHEFIFDLTWKVDQTASLIDDAANRLVRDRFPSWSWASVHGRVTYSFDNPLSKWKYDPYVVDRCVVESVICNVDAPNRDMRAATHSGVAILTGARAAVKLTVDTTDGKHKAYVWSAHSPFRVEVSLDSYEFAPPNVGQGGDGSQYGFCCLRLFSWIANASGSRRMGPETWFLVLRPSTKVSGAFERIGVGVYSEWPAECPLFRNPEAGPIKVV